MPADSNARDQISEFLVDQCARLALLCEALLVPIERGGREKPRRRQATAVKTTQLQECSRHLSMLAWSEVADQEMTDSLLSAVALAERATAQLRAASAPEGEQETAAAVQQSASIRLLSHLGQVRQRIIAAASASGMETGAVAK
jgi:hypothetical protein